MACKATHGKMYAHSRYRHETAWERPQFFLDSGSTTRRGGQERCTSRRGKSHGGREQDAPQAVVSVKHVQNAVTCEDDDLHYINRKYTAEKAYNKADIVHMYRYVDPQCDARIDSR
jgi:plasmid replication initiation protein